jgi:hypothetical protein
MKRSQLKRALFCGILEGFPAEKLVSSLGIEGG